MLYMCVSLCVYICIEYLTRKYLWEGDSCLLIAFLVPVPSILYLIYILNNPVRLVDYIHLIHEVTEVLQSEVTCPWSFNLSYMYLVSNSGSLCH